MSAEFDGTAATGEMNVTAFTIEYRKTGYALADAFRPDPMWGRKIYTVDGDKIGSNDQAEIRKAARQTAPDGYEIHSVMPSNANVCGLPHGKEDK